MVISAYEMLLALVQFVEFEKREKYPWRGVTFSKVPGSNTPPWVFLTF